MAEAYDFIPIVHSSIVSINVQLQDKVQDQMDETERCECVLQYSLNGPVVFKLPETKIMTPV